MHKTTHVLALMFSRLNRISIFPNYPFAILISIIGYETMKINLQVIFRESHGNVDLFDNTWVLASVIGSTLLGFLSDRFMKFSWRKPICLIGILCSLITGIAFLHPALHNISNKAVILFFILLNGLSGSYIGAVRAFYLDQFPNAKMMRFAVTVVFQCIPWVLIGLALDNDKITPDSLSYLSIAIQIVALLAGMLIVQDKRVPQFEASHGIKELQQIAKKYNRARFWSIILPFFILAITYHLMPYLGEYTFSTAAFYQEILLLGLGVGIGVPLAFILIKRPALQTLKLGYLSSLIYFLILGVLYWTNAHIATKTLMYQFFIFAVQGGFLWVISVKNFLITAKFTEDGLILGFIESIQSLGEFAGAAIASWLFPVLAVGHQDDIVLPFVALLGMAFACTFLDRLFGRSQRN